MATTTTRFGLRKPDPDPITGDLIDVETDLNDNWDIVDSIVGVTSCTSGTRPATPYTPQMIRETDTGKVYIYSGSAWMQIATDVGSSGFSLDDLIDIRRTSATDAIFRGRLNSGDTVDRFVIENNGRLQWGSGSGSVDTNLYRDSANNLKTDDTFTAADFMIASRSLPRGIMGTPASTSSSGSTFNSSTAVRDSVLGNYSFTAVASRTYLVCYIGAKYSAGTAANNLVSVNIRDGGASTPTAASTLVANGSIIISITGGGGQQSLVVFGTFSPSAGTRTLAVFNDVNTANTMTPVAARQLFAIDIGPA